VHVPRDQGGGTALGKPGGIDLLVHVPEAPRIVHHQSALQLGPIEDVGAVDVFDIEWRVLAHQNNVEFAEFSRGARAASEPIAQIVEDLERRQVAPGDTV